MAFLYRRFPLSERSKRVIRLSTGLNLLYTGLVFGYSIYPGMNVSIFGTLWHALVLSSIMAFGLSGFPFCSDSAMRFEVRAFSWRVSSCSGTYWLNFRRLEVDGVTPPGFSSCSSVCRSISWRTDFSPVGKFGSGVVTSQPLPRAHN